MKALCDKDGTTDRDDPFSRDAAKGSRFGVRMTDSGEVMAVVRRLSVSSDPASGVAILPTVRDVMNRHIARIGRCQWLVAVIRSIEWGQFADSPSLPGNAPVRSQLCKSM